MTDKKTYWRLPMGGSCYSGKIAREAERLGGIVSPPFLHSRSGRMQGRWHVDFPAAAACHDFGLWLEGEKEIDLGGVVILKVTIEEADVKEMWAEVERDIRPAA